MVGQHLSALGGDPDPDHGGSVNGRVVPSEKPMAFHHFRELLSPMCPELAEDIGDVISVDHGVLLGAMCL